MKTLHPVVWSKGMFLTPQHFQTQDRFVQDLLDFRFSASHFANWGVVTLSVDTDALANGIFALNGCRGILPDGMGFQIPEVDQPPASRTVAEHFPPSEESLDVFLAIPELGPRTRNVTVVNGQSGTPGYHADTRYIAETRAVIDSTGGAEEKPVQVARTNFRLLFSDEPLDGFSALRLARIRRNAAGTYIPDPRFIAPCLDIGSSDYLMRLLRRQLEILASRSSVLSDSRREQGKSLADFTTSDVSTFWLLHTANSFIPLLKHIWSVRRGHPEPLYAAMLQLAGALSTFSLENGPQDLPQYDHDNLGACFTALDDRIRNLINTVIPPESITIALKLTDQFIWTGAITEDQYFRNAQFYLSISADMGVDDLIREAPRRIKIASPMDIQRLIRNALPGITLRHVPAPPAAIRLRLGNQYFSLNQSGPLWDGLVQSRGVCVYAPSELVNPKMELIVVLSTGG